MTATGRMTAAAAQIDPSYSPKGANVTRDFLAHESLPP